MVEEIITIGENQFKITYDFLTPGQRDQVIEQIAREYGCKTCNSGNLQTLQGTCTAVNTVPSYDPTTGTWDYSLGLTTTLSGGTSPYTLYWFKFPPGVTPTFPPAGSNLIQLQPGLTGTAFSFGYSVPTSESLGTWTYGAYIEDSSSPVCTTYQACTVQVVVPTTPTPAPTVFGYTTPGATSVDPGVGNPRACVFTAPATGTVSSITIYGRSTGTSTIDVALYADNGAGKPGTLLSTGTATVIVAAAGWYTVNITPYTVTANTPYWLAFQSDGAFYYYFDTGATNQTEGWAGTWDTWASNPTISGYWARLTSIYATYSGIPPTPTPTPTVIPPTPTPTRTPTPTPTVIPPTPTPTPTKPPCNLTNTFNTS